MFPKPLSVPSGDYVQSQKHLLKATDHNPQPTLLPPPAAALSAIGRHERLVASFIGLPLRGKGYMAQRLKQYLEFFHGVEVAMFDICQFTEPGGDQRLLRSMGDFFAGGEQDSQNTHAHQAEQSVKGRFAILYTKDTQDSLPSMWGGHEKFRRRWMAETLEENLQASIMFIEIQADDTALHRQDYMERLEHARGLKTGEISKNICKFARYFVTIQDDGTEDDLTYMKLNYNSKVMTNNMMRSFLGSRVAHFLASVHPYSRTIYLTRHGESQYNKECKIGGDSSLSELGSEYAHRLGEFAELVVTGKCQRIACTSVSSSEADALEALLEDSCLTDRGNASGSPSVLAKTDWVATSIKDPLAAGVCKGMRLLRLRRASGKFEDAPTSVSWVLAEVRKGPVELIFVTDKEQSCCEEPIPARLWTSSMRRTKETAEHIKHPKLKLNTDKSWLQMRHREDRNLDEIYAGEFEGLTYEEIRRREPKEASLRKIDKLGYRYPRGESYYDLITRLDTPIHRLETIQEPVLIISHQAVLRLVYAFLVGIPREQATTIEIPLHSVIQVNIDGTGWRAETRHQLGPFHAKNSDGQKHL